MNPVIQAQVEQFKVANPLPAYSDSDYFECYSVFSVVNGHMTENIDPFEVHLRGKEFGIDGACALVQGQLAVDADAATALTEQFKDSAVDFIFVQAKSGNQFDYGEISKFLDAVHGFFYGTMDAESQQLDDLIHVKNVVYRTPLRNNPRLKCFFVTTGTYQEVNRIEKLLEAQHARLSDMNLFQTIEIELLGAKTLQESYRAATSSNTGEIEFSKCQTMPSHMHVEQAYIGYIKADQLINIATRPGEVDNMSMNQSVFFDNVRDFDPKSKINQAIIQEVMGGDRSGFVFRNNGVTVIAKKISRTGDRFVVDDYQIVNGCQTTNVLFECRENIDDINVPLRLIECRDEGFVTSIIVGTRAF